MLGNFQVPSNRPEPHDLLSSTMKTWKEDRLHKHTRGKPETTQFTQTGERKQTHRGRDRRGQCAHKGERDKRRESPGGRRSKTSGMRYRWPGKRESSQDRRWSNTEERRSEK